MTADDGETPSHASPDFQAIFEATPGILLVLAPDPPRFTLLAASADPLAATPSAREGTIGRSLFDVFADANPVDAGADGVATLRASLETVLRTRAPHQMPVQRHDLRRPDGALEVRYRAPRNVPVLAPDGSVRYLLHHALDVTDLVLGRESIAIAGDAIGTDITKEARSRRDTEAALADSDRARAEAEAARARSEAVLSSIADAFYLLDRDWRFTYVNDAAEPLLHTRRDALLGRTLWEAFPGVIGSEFEGPYREAMATGRVTAAESYFEPLETWFDVRTYPWTGGLMVHFRDIGARKAAEAERERLLDDAEAARREAEAANRAKSEFLAVMSHELRTPLNAIGGYAELLEMGIHGPVTSEQRAALDRIQRSQRALLSVINEVLNYARLETGAVTYELEDVLLTEAVASAEVLVAPQLRAKGLAYRWDGCREDLTVRADRDKLQQVLLNLLSNAIKFTEPREGQPGRIDVSCAVAPDGRHILVQVHDTGAGIPSDKLEAVFEPFVQVDQRLTRENSGTGLGLAISRDLARGMGGELSAESEVGVGSTFTLTLPAATRQAHDG